MAAEEKIDVKVVEEEKEPKKGFFTKIGEGIDHGVDTVTSGIRKHKAVAVAGAAVAAVGVAKIVSNVLAHDDEDRDEAVGYLETEDDVLDIDPLDVESVGTEETVA